VGHSSSAGKNTSGADAIDKFSIQNKGNLTKMLLNRNVLELNNLQIVLNIIQDVWYVLLDGRDSTTRTERPAQAAPFDVAS
jgi:hypothetical protein